MHSTLSADIAANPEFFEASDDEQYPDEPREADDTAAAQSPLPPRSYDTNSDPGSKSPNQYKNPITEGKWGHDTFTKKQPTRNLTMEKIGKRAKKWKCLTCHNTNDFPDGLLYDGTPLDCGYCGARIEGLRPLEEEGGAMQQYGEASWAGEGESWVTEEDDDEDEDDEEEDDEEGDDEEGDDEE